MKIQDKMKIGNVEVNGRIIMPPMGTYKCTEDGFVTEEVLDYYKQRAENPNVGLIITEHSYVDLGGKQKANQMSISEDANIDGLRQLVDMVHATGTKVFAQLNHAGSASLREVCKAEPLAPTSMILPSKPQLGDTIPPKEMTKEDIAYVTKKFAEAAKRAKEIGYDGVEIHSAHSYLLNQFYSPLTNKRTDEYGGSLENRVRFLVEVLCAVRAEVGKDYPISVRLGGCDYMEGGSTIEDAVETAKTLAAEGIELLSLTGGMCRYMRSDKKTPGYFSDMSEAVKAVVDVPVLLTGGVKTLAAAEALVEEGAADFIGVGRSLLAHADWEM